MPVVASGRNAHVSTRLTSSGSPLVEAIRDRGIVGDVRVEEPRVQIILAQQFLAGVHRALELTPCLSHHLFTRALYRGAPGRSRSGPVRNIDRQDAVNLAVAEELGRHVMPELELGDAGQSPFRVDVNHVPMRGRQVAVQIELDAVHPLHIGGERAQVGERGVARQHAGVHQRGNSLDRQRSHVEVAGRDGSLSLPVDDDAGDSSVRAENLVDLAPLT